MTHKQGRSQVRLINPATGKCGTVTPARRSSPRPGPATRAVGNAMRPRRHLPRGRGDGCSPTGGAQPRGCVRSTASSQRRPIAPSKAIRSGDAYTKRLAGAELSWRKRFDGVRIGWCGLRSSGYRPRNSPRLAARAAFHSLPLRGGFNLLRRTNRLTTLLRFRRIGAIMGHGSFQPFR